MKIKTLIILLTLFITLAGSSSACGNTQSTASTKLKLAPQSALPDFVLEASPEIQEAYRFAMANPEILKQYPCYCGCQEVLAHMHNLDCYIKQFNADGSIEVDPHTLT